MEMQFVPEVGSTNDCAIDAAREGAAHGWAVRAGRQMTGRGRRGHAWASDEGNLYLSVVLRPQVGMHQFVALPAVVAMGVLDALRDLGTEAGLSERIGIKWPNDIVARRDLANPAYPYKLAGILVEAKAGADGPFAVAGVGLNVHAVKASAPELAGEGSSPLALDPVSLEELVADAQDGNAAGASSSPLLDPAVLAERLRDAIVARVDAWAVAVKTPQGAAGPMAPILSEYFDMVPMLGRQVAVLTPEGHAMDIGVFSGLDVWGRASVTTPAGEQAFAAEQVSLREL